jgi:hypothetical protein
VGALDSCRAPPEEHAATANSGPLTRHTHERTRIALLHDLAIADYANAADAVDSELFQTLLGDPCYRRTVKTSPNEDAGVTHCRFRASG